MDNQLFIIDRWRKKANERDLKQKTNEPKNWKSEFHNKKHNKMHVYCKFKQLIRNDIRKFILLLSLSCCFETKTSFNNQKIFFLFLHRHGSLIYWVNYRQTNDQYVKIHKTKTSWKIEFSYSWIQWIASPVRWWDI